MIIVLDNNTITISNIFVANTFSERLFGYMFRKQPHHKAIIFKPCNSIHTFFMKFNIDVLFLNNNMEVIKKVEALKPGKVIMPVKEAVVVIEGEEGSFKEVAEGFRIIELYNININTSRNNC